MPIFEYQCDCGLRFERSGKMAQATVEQACPVCGKDSPRVPPSSVGFAFKQTSTSGPVPQNTGISAYDYNVDRIVGSEAAERWAVVEQREARKREVLVDAPGATKKDLSALPDGEYHGDYRVMGTAEKRTVRNTRAFHNLAAGLAGSKDRYQLLKKVSEAGK